MSRTGTAIALILAGALSAWSVPGPAAAAPAQNAQRQCATLLKPANRDHCRTELARGEWPCSNLPVPEREDLKRCSQAFDLTLFNRNTAPLPAIPELDPDLDAQSDPATPATAATPSPPPAQLPTAAPPTSAPGEVLPLRIIDMRIASTQAAQRATLERQRQIESVRADIALRLESKEQKASAADVLQLQAELNRLQAESEQLARRYEEQNDAIEAATQQRKQAENDLAVEAERVRKQKLYLRYAIVAAAGLLLTVLLGAYLLWRRQNEKRRNAERRVVAEQQRSDRILKARPEPFQDCLLDDGGSKTYVLHGSLLSDGGLVVGRHPGQAQIIINRPEISRRHAKFLVRNGGIVIEDLGSANGTKVNDVALRVGEQTPLRDGARIQFGPLSFTLRVGAGMTVR